MSWWLWWLTSCVSLAQLLPSGDLRECGWASGNQFKSNQGSPRRNSASDCRTDIPPELPARRPTQQILDSVFQVLVNLRTASLPYRFHSHLPVSKWFYGSVPREKPKVPLPQQQVSGFLGNPNRGPIPILFPFPKSVFPCPVPSSSWGDSLQNAKLVLHKELTTGERLYREELKKKNLLKSNTLVFVLTRS